ncbi:MAG: glycoside hydrolase family 76 protein [Eubacteriales bacterium]
MKAQMKLLASAMAVLTLLPTVLACGGTKPAETTADTTSAATGENEEPAPDYAALLASNPYGAPAETLMVETIEKYYSKRSHTVQTDLNNQSTAYVWPTTAFVEALAESYVMYPDNATIKNCYIDMLDNGFDQFKVTNATLTTPSGRHSGITYYNSSRGNQGDYYYDDNAWICVRYLTAYEQFGNEDYLKRAKEILEFLWTGYDDFQGGGIYWDKSYSGNKGVCTNGPATISHLWMYQITGEEIYLQRGTELYNWVNENLRTSGGIYFAGVNDPWQPAYDQGTMLYATCLMYEITGDDAYLKLARKSTTAIASHMFTVEGSGESMVVTMKRNPIFKAWCVGWLTRGMVKYVATDTSKKSNTYMKMLKNVMDQTLQTKDANGQYDPFFCSKGTDFWDKDYHDHDVMQPAGIVIVLQLLAYYDVYQINESYAD